ncbi:hypothetical protein ACRRTK_010421 [Alexandromys fortis]
MNPNPPRGHGLGEGRGAKGGKNFFLAPRREARCRRELGVLGPARRYAAARAHFLARHTPRPPPCTRRTWCPGTEPRERGREERGCGRRRARPMSSPPLHAQLAQRLSGSPQRRPGALRAAGCRRPRRLEGAALSVARGRLNPFLGLPGLGRGVRSDGREHRRTHRARRRLGTPGHPLAAARPAPHPQQFTCWSPQLAARQGRAAGTLWRWPQPPSLR